MQSDAEVEDGLAGLRAAEQMAKILNGAKPAEMPVEQVTGIEMVVNLKTAAALGVTIPPLIRTRATRVIE